MTARGLFGSARAIDAENICLTRASLFNNIGIADPYRREIPGSAELVDVRSERERSLLGYARSHADRPIIDDVLVDEIKLGGDIDRQAVAEAFARRGASDVYCGCVLKLADRYVVLVHAQNRCWARFLLSKELSHIITNTVGAVGDVIIELADTLLQDADCWKDVFKDVDAQIEDEAVGVFHAIEVLLPWRLRKEFREVLGNKPNFTTAAEENQWESSVSLQLAKRFMIPQKVIAYSLKGKGFGSSKFGSGLSYLDLSWKMNESMDKAAKMAKGKKASSRGE